MSFDSFVDCRFLCFQVLRKHGALWLSGTCFEATKSEGLSQIEEAKSKNWKGRKLLEKSIRYCNNIAIPRIEMESPFLGLEQAKFVLLFRHARQIWTEIGLKAWLL